jgi:hypothetical protein
MSGATAILGIGHEVNAPPISKRIALLRIAHWKTRPLNNIRHNGSRGQIDLYL